MSSPVFPSLDNIYCSLYEKLKGKKCGDGRWKMEDEKRVCFHRTHLQREHTREWAKWVSEWVSEPVNGASGAKLKKQYLHFTLPFELWTPYYPMSFTKTYYLKYQKCKYEYINVTILACLLFNFSIQTHRKDTEAFHSHRFPQIMVLRRKKKGGVN